jgi:hypothetical protein
MSQATANLKRGSIIKAFHDESGRKITYVVAEECSMRTSKQKYYRLFNLTSSMMMACKPEVDPNQLMKNIENMRVTVISIIE